MRYRRVGMNHPSEAERNRRNYTLEGRSEAYLEARGRGEPLHTYHSTARSHPAKNHPKRIKDSINESCQGCFSGQLGLGKAL